MPTEPTEPRTSKPLSPLDPPEVIEGVILGMDRYAEEVDARRAAKGLPPMRKLTAEEAAAMRRAVLSSATRAVRVRPTPRLA